MDRVVIYTPLEDILYNQGGFMIVLAVILAGLVFAGVYSLIEKKFGSRRAIRAWGKYNVRGNVFATYNGWISTAAAVGFLFLLHLANVKGWL